MSAEIWHLWHFRTYSMQSVSSVSQKLPALWIFISNICPFAWVPHIPSCTSSMKAFASLASTHLSSIENESLSPLRKKLIANLLFSCRLQRYQEDTHDAEYTAWYDIIIPGLSIYHQAVWWDVPSFYLERLYNCSFCYPHHWCVARASANFFLDRGM